MKLWSLLIFLTSTTFAVCSEDDFQKQMPQIELLFSQGEYDQALAELASLESESMDCNESKAFISSFRGLIYYRLCHFEESVEQFKKALGEGEKLSEKWQKTNRAYLGWSGYAAAIQKNDVQKTIPFLEAFSEVLDADEITKLIFSVASHYFEKDMYEEASLAYESLLTGHSQHDLIPQTLYFYALSLEKAGKKEPEVRHSRKELWGKFPSSPLAPEAYLNTFSTREYLENSPSAIDHLKGMASLFPSNPLLIHAYYILGLFYSNCDSTRISHKISNEGGRDVAPDSLTMGQEHCPRDKARPIGGEDGVTDRSDSPRVCEKSGLNQALDYFSSLIQLYQNLLEQGTIPEELSETLAYIEARALLEKGSLLQTNSKIFEQFLQEIETLPLKSYDVKFLKEEGTFCLAKSLFQTNEPDQAEKIIDMFIQSFETERITRGYYLSRAWVLKGSIFAQKNEHSRALQCFSKAKEAAQGNILNGDQIIDLYLQESESYKALSLLEDAMLTLSNAVNEKVVSSLRLKAMYLRAEIYAQQGRPDLAERQLESLSKKQGEWAIKAKNKLKELKKLKKRLA